MDDPGLVFPALLADQGFEKPPLLDAIDRGVDFFELIAIQLERAAIRERGATV